MMQNAALNQGHMDKISETTNRFDHAEALTTLREGALAYLMQVFEHSREGAHGRKIRKWPIVSDLTMP